MRNAIYILAGLVLSGCATEKPAMPVSNISPPISRPCAALVFDVPITQIEPEIVLARDDRGLAAFAGFQETSVSSYDIVNYDRQSSNHGDRFVRESVTEQTGTVSR